jgi:cytochrome c-type biogenesis protein CcmH/NrfG
MTKYQIALFIHLLALLAATAASAIVKLAAGRRADAPTLREALEWGKLIGTTSRTFPIAVFTLVATGAYMTAGRWGWRQGWIEAGVLGSLLLLASGAALGRRGAVQAQASVLRLKSATHELPNDESPDRLAAVLSGANTGLALAIAFVMTTKPGFAPAMGVLAIGAAAGGYHAYSGLRVRSTVGDTSEFEAA